MKVETNQVTHLMQLGEAFVKMRVATHVEPTHRVGSLQITSPMSEGEHHIIPAQSIYTTFAGAHEGLNSGVRELDELILTLIDLRYHMTRPQFPSGAYFLCPVGGRLRFQYDVKTHQMVLP